MADIVDFEERWNLHKEIDEGKHKLIEVLNMAPTESSYILTSCAVGSAQ